MNVKSDERGVLSKYWENNYQWTINQHYVPQFYLKQFTNEKWLIETLDKKRKTVKLNSTKHICSGEYFYWVETWKKDKISQLLEDFFKETENDFADNYKSIVENILDYNIKISDDLIFKLSEFVAVSYLRWKFFKENFKKMSENIGKQLMIHDYRARKYYTPNDPSIKKISNNEKLEKKLLNWEFNIKENNMHYFKYMFDNLGNYISWFHNKKKIFYISNWERNFITTDSCVSEITPEVRSPYWVWFFEKIHYFPLSPKILVVYYNPLNNWKDWKRKQIWKWETVYHNFLCWINCDYLYSKSKSDFDEREYTKVRSMYADELYELLPSVFEEDKKLKDDKENFAKKIWVPHKQFYDQRCDSIIWWSSEK